MTRTVVIVQTDEFEVEACSLGELDKVRVAVDSSRQDAWFLERLVVWEQDRPNRKWSFPCGRWFAIDQVGTLPFHRFIPPHQLSSLTLFSFLELFLFVILFWLSFRLFSI